MSREPGNTRLQWEYLPIDGGAGRSAAIPGCIRCRLEACATFAKLLEAPSTGRCAHACLTQTRCELHLHYMSASTPTSLRLAPADKRLLTRAARARGMSLQKYLVDAGRKAAATPASDLGRELERLAVDGMARIAVERIRARQIRQWTDAQVTAEVQAARR